MEQTETPQMMETRCKESESISEVKGQIETPPLFSGHTHQARQGGEAGDMQHCYQGNEDTRLLGGGGA